MTFATHWSSFLKTFFNVFRILEFGKISVHGQCPSIGHFTFSCCCQKGQETKEGERGKHIWRKKSVQPQTCSLFFGDQRIGKTVFLSPSRRMSGRGLVMLQHAWAYQNFCQKLNDLRKCQIFCVGWIHCWSRLSLSALVLSCSDETFPDISYMCVINIPVLKCCYLFRNYIFACWVVEKKIIDRSFNFLPEVHWGMRRHEFLPSVQKMQSAI